MLTSGAYGYLADYLAAVIAYVSLLVHTWCFFRFFPRQRLPKLGLVLGNALIFGCLLGLTALGAESYLRFLSVQTDAFGMSLPARRWFALHTELNSLGCRDKEWTIEKPAGVWRIAFVGDSFTYGWGIERVQDRFPDRIQALFDKTAPHGIPNRDRKGAALRVEVMNVAKPGWDTGAELAPVRDMIDVYGVDEVVLGYVPNDIEKLLPRTSEFDPIRPPAPTFINIDSSCLVDYLYRRLWLPREPTVRRYHDWLAEGFADPGIWRRHQEQLARMIEYCRDRDVTFRVVLLPFIRTQGEKYQPAKLHEKLRRFFEGRRVPVIDLWPTIAGRCAADLIVNRQDAHPNVRAHALFAEAIWQAFYAPP